MIPTLTFFINMAQQSNALNCYGYVYNGNPGATLSYNASLNNNQSGNGLACSAIKLYIPYILLVFLIFGVSKMLYSKAEDYFGGTGGVGG